MEGTSKTKFLFAMAGVFFAGSLASTIPAGAQSFDDLKKPRSPLVLEAQGSFYVGGETVEQTTTELGNLGTPGHISVNQMYVQYMIPIGGHRNVPVVMVHGGTLSGKGYETQPDGRMGWAEYFVRKGYPVYIPDQVSRARSGFNQATYNNVRAGIVPPSSQANILRISNEAAWTLFRFGPTFGVPYPDEQFPVESVDEFAKQGIPDLNATLPSPNPTNQALADLGRELKGAVIMGHSESGRFPLEAALIDPKATKGLIVMEPGNCDGYTDQQIAILADVPILTVFGDHLDTPGSVVDWVASFNSCNAFVDRVNAAGGNAQMLYPPDLGIFGNSHMLMNDKNSDQIADLIIKWIDKNVDRRRVADKDDKKDKGKNDKKNKKDKNKKRDRG